MFRFAALPGPPKRPAVLAGIAALLLAFAGCEDGTGSTPVPVRVDVGADSVVLFRDSTYTLTATVLDESGRTVEGTALQWRSSDPAVATVDAVGHVRAVKVGSAYAVASYTRSDGRTLSDSARVVVRPPLAFVAFSAGNTPLNPVSPVDVSAGTRIDLSVLVGADNQPLAGAPVTLSVTQGSATVTPASGTTGPDGRLAVAVTFGAATGPVVVEARTPWATQAGRFSAVVYPPVRSQLEPDSLVLTVGCMRTLVMRIKQPNGTDVVGASANFAVEDSTLVALETPAIGGSYRGVTRNVTARKLGTTRIIATYQPFVPVGQGAPAADTAAVRVVPSVPSQVSFSTRSFSVGIGGQSFATPSVLDQCGMPMTGSTLQFRTTDPSVVELGAASAGGIAYRGVRTGTARIIAELGSLADTLTVTVRNVRIAPADTTVSVGSTLDLRVLMEDASGNMVPVSGAVFTAADTPVYSLTQSGRFTAKQSGTADVTGFAAGVFVGTRIRIVP